MRGMILILAAVFVAGPALALGNMTDCRDPSDATKGVTTGTALSGRVKACYQFTTDVNSPMIQVGGDGVLICFDPDQASAAGAARVQVWSCPYGIVGWDGESGVTATQLQQCFLVSPVLDGVGGSSGSQTACTEHLPHGRYVIDPTVAPGGGEKPVVVLMGE